MQIPAFCSPAAAVAWRGASVHRSIQPFPTHHLTFCTKPLRRRQRLRNKIMASSSIPDDSTDINTLRQTIINQTLVVTTPLFYANAAPHMGSAYPTIAADALCRFYKLANGNPILITGTDEHGEKIATAASATTRDTQSFVDGVAGKFKTLWSQLDIQYDQFVRTTDSKHKKIVEQVMQRVWDNGDIYKDLYDGLYCTGCEEYKVESELNDGNICPTHLKPCEQRTEQNYFFALSKYQKQLEELLEDPQSPFVIHPPERRNEVLGWVRSGLRDFSVSRANNPWGIPVPRDTSHTIYVWFDALVGYISALLPDGGNISDADSKGWPAHVHVIGKDILRFHAVYWPAMLMSAGLKLPKRVMGHGFITKDGLKMGKSLGNTLDPEQLVRSHGSDAVRFFFLRAVDFGRDGDFSETRFVDSVNADLANSVGNLLNRSLNLARKNCPNGLPKIDAQLLDTQLREGKAVVQAAEKAAMDAYVAYAEMDFVGACESIMRISYEANTFIDRVAPWTKFKSEKEADVEAARQCLAITLEACRVVAVGLSPVVPELSKNIYGALGLGGKWIEGVNWDDDMRWGRLPAGIVFAKPQPVFPRVDVTVLEKQLTK